MTLLNGGKMNIDKLKKDELLAHARTLVQENKKLKKELESKGSIDESSLNDYFAITSTISIIRTYLPKIKTS